jgi:hypothetical protein
MSKRKTELKEKYSKYFSSDVIPNYEITFKAKNVTPKQRDFFYDLLVSAYDEIVKSDTISVNDAENMSIGETKVSETDWSDPKHWVGEQSY